MMIFVTHCCNFELIHNNFDSSDNSNVNDDGVIPMNSTNLTTVAEAIATTTTAAVLQIMTYDTHDYSISQSSNKAKQTGKHYMSKFQDNIS